MSSKQDQIRTEITNRIVESIKGGSLPPWRQSWANDANCGASVNVIKKAVFDGVNRHYFFQGLNNASPSGLE